MRPFPVQPFPWSPPDTQDGAATPASPHAQPCLPTCFHPPLSLRAGADLLSLLYNLLDEFLFRFVADDCMVCREVKVLEFDTDNGRMKVQGCVPLERRRRRWTRPPHLCWRAAGPRRRIGRRQRVKGRRALLRH